MLWNSTNVPALLGATFAAHPESKYHLNFFFTAGTFGSAAAFSLLPSDDHDYDQAIVMLGQTQSDGSGSNLNYGGVGLAVHELGHIFGLQHTMTAGCCTESPNLSCNYLTDVFCPPTNPYPQSSGWSCDPTLPPSVNTCTNNIMGGTKEQCLFSPQQLGRAHRTLSIENTEKYVKPAACLRPPSDMALWLPLDETIGSIASNLFGPAGAHAGGPAKTPGKVAGSLLLQRHLAVCRRAELRGCQLQSLDSTAPFRVGATTIGTPDSFFNGCIDEVVAYSRTLSLSEIQTLYDAGSAGRCKRFCTASSLPFPAGVTSGGVQGRICNATTVPQEYLSWIEGLPSQICGTVDGPSFSPCTAMITVPPGTCTTVGGSVTRPAGFNGTAQSACYRITVQSLGNDDVTKFLCEGQLNDYCANSQGCPSTQ